MPHSIYKSAIVVVTSIGILATPLISSASGYPACTNNKITIAGVNGPEVWSCVSVANSSPASSVVSKVGVSNNSQQQAVTPSTTELTVEKRTEASGESMKSEIKRVLEETKNVKNTKRPKNFSAGLQYSTNRKNRDLRDNRSRTLVMPLGIGINVTNRTSLSATVPLIHKAREVVGGSGVVGDDVQGIGDISLNARSQILGETEKRPSLALNFGLGVPTGKVEDPRTSNKMSIGSGFWTASAGATVAKRFDPATVFGSIRYQHAMGDEQFGYEIQPGSSLEYSYGLGLSINNSLSVSGHIAGSIHRNTTVNGVEIDGSNSEPLEFVTSSTLRFNKNSRFESNISIGLNKDASDATFGFTLTRDF